MRTIIKRCHTIAALKRMEAGNFAGVYAKRLEPFLSEEWIPHMPCAEMVVREVEAAVF